MTRSIRRKASYAGIGLAAAGGLLALGLAGPGIALADPSPTPSGSASAPADVDRDAKRAQARDEFAQALADELGVDKAKVAAALDKIDTAQRDKAKTERLTALKARLDAAVAAGTLTREEADAILKAAEKGVWTGGPGLGAGPGAGPGRGGHARPGR